MRGDRDGVGRGEGAEGRNRKGVGGWDRNGVGGRSTERGWGLVWSPGGCGADWQLEGRRVVREGELGLGVPGTVIFWSAVRDDLQGRRAHCKHMLL